jgi:PadR family transcriptional regulator AphA
MLHLLYVTSNILDGGVGMSLEAAIMGFLAEEPRSGYDLKTRCFDEQAARFWTADQAQIYRTLERLQSARMVSCTRKRQLGKPDRKIYRLTAAGVHALRLWLTSPLPAAPPRDSFLMKLFFSAALDDDEIVERLVQRRRVHQSRLEQLRSELVSPVGGKDVSERTRLLREAAYDGAIARERASIDWLDDSIEAVESGRLPADERVHASDRAELTESGSA